jgi:Bacterial dipeptidyl-peptidase Sh3 domain/NlpC/P60 family
MRGQQMLHQMQVIRPRACLHDEPSRDASLETELLAGDIVSIIDEEGGEWAKVHCERDGYKGYVHRIDIARRSVAFTHRVDVASTLALQNPKLESAMDARALFLNSRVIVSGLGDKGRFLVVKGFGWVPRLHLTRIDDYETDPVAVGLRFVGVPYRLGGSVACGIDCSGLMQQAHLACDIRIPRNAKDQMVWEGDLDHPVVDVTLPRRNVCVFWRRHVGIMVDESNILHANADTMDVVVHPFSHVVARRGEPLAMRRFIE